MAKSVLIDTSSAILLYKAFLFNKVADLYDLIISHSVFLELTRSGYPGAEFFNQHSGGKIQVIKVDHNQIKIFYKDDLFPGLDAGERDLLILQEEMNINFVIIDDLRGVKYCMGKLIPHINALLIPKILLYLNYLTENECIDKIEEIIAIGRYSARVIDFALNCKMDDLSEFLT